LSLNPLAHLDVLGTLFFVLFGFGWARPVPVNPRNFENPRLGMLQVALAGPLANVTMAFLLGGLLQATGFSDATLAGAFVLIVIRINIILALFNLIPIPPLDGSRILESLLPASQALTYSRLQPYGTLVLLVLLYTGMVGRVISPAIEWLYLATTRGIGRP
jgi:Zn-dependent protease